MREPRHPVAGASATFTVIDDGEQATLRSRLDTGDGGGAVATYAAYLNQRSGSYMKLETEGGSAFDMA